MALNGGQPNQFGQSHLNLWAILKSLAFNGLGFAPISGAPVDGTSGSYAKFAGPGFMLFDITTGDIYINRSLTAFSPVWVNLNGPVAGNAGLGVLGNAKATYDFAVDGGATTTITPLNSPTLPINAIILGGVIDIPTALTSGGSATIGIGLGSGGQVAALKAPTAVASYSLLAALPLIPLFTAATYVKVAAASRITITVATATLLTGKMDINLAYVQGE